MRINYSTVILGLRTNVWTAIIVFVLGCILFVVLYQYGPDPKAQARGLAAVTADELERQSIEEEQLRQKRKPIALSDTTINSAETARNTGLQVPLHR